MSLTSLLKTFRVLTVKHSIKHVSCAFSSKAPPQGVIKRVDPATGEIKTKKTNIIPKITLISGENITITTLQEAEKLSKRRDLKLVKVVDLDAKTQRPVYQLMTGAEYHAEDLKQREKRKLDKQQSLKGEKILLINSRITQHDLETQLRKAIKWLQKMYEVRVVINGANGGGDAAEKIYSSIDQFFKSEDSEAKLVQKRTKGSDIKFQILPPTSKIKRDL